MMHVLRNLVIALVLVLGLTFAFFNADDVTLDYLLGKVETPLVVVLVLDFVLGIGVAALWFYGRILRLKAELAGTKRKLREAQDEIKTLRSMPIHDA